MDSLMKQGDRRIVIGFFLIALLLYAPGIWWGVPHATSPERTLAWGSDELGPLGSIGELHSVFLDPDPSFNPQYPLLHYFVQSAFILPYLILLWIGGGLTKISGVYPFGLADPIEALKVITILSRIPSLLMGAGTVSIAFLLGKKLWGKRAGLISGTFVLLLYPMFYYSRTSNVDMPALLWISLGVLIAVQIMEDTLTVKRALWLGIIAAIATATKDGSYIVFLMLGLVVSVRHLGQRSSADGNLFAALKPLAIALTSAIAVYLVASGLVLEPARFAQHVRYIRNTTAVYLYPNTLPGYLQLTGESIGHVVASLGIPTAILAVSGFLKGWRRAPYLLLLALIPIGIFIGTIIPVRFVNFRYVMVMALIWVFLAAYAIDALLGSDRHLYRRLGKTMMLIAFGWSLIRGYDQTHQMLNDGRYELARWIEQNAKPGDRVGFYGASQKLPALPADVMSVQMEGFCSKESWHSAGAPEFVVLIPQQHFSIDYEFSLSEEWYQGLVDGSLGYQRVLWLQAQPLTSRRPVPFVNAPIQVYVNTRDGFQRSDDMVDVKKPMPLLAPLEELLGTEYSAPAGLRWNHNRATPPCGIPNV